MEANNLAREVQELKTNMDKNFEPRLKKVEETLESIPKALDGIKHIMIGFEQPENMKESLYSKVSKVHTIIDKHKVWLRFQPRTLFIFGAVAMLSLSLLYVKELRDAWLPDFIITLLTRI